MRILSLIYSLGGGGGQVLTGLVGGLKHHEHCVFFIAPDPQYGTGAERELDAMGVPHREIRNPALPDEIAAWRPDLVVYHWWPLFSETYNPARFCGVPSVLVNHCGDRPPAGFDAYVAVSRFGARWHSHIDPKRARIVYNGIDVARFNVPREEHDGFVIGRVSSLEPKKAPPDLVDFCASVPIADARFVMLGEGSRRAEFARRAGELGIADRVELPGRLDRDGVLGQLARFDISCYVTDWHVEIHSVSLLEKAAAGIPIVAEPRGGIPEQVVHGQTGFLGHDREDLGAWCGLLRRDRKLRRAMGASARRLARRFSLEAQCSAYDRLFRELKDAHSVAN